MRKTWMTTLRRVFDDDDDDGDETTVVGRGEPRRGRVRGDRGDVCAECVRRFAMDGCDLTVDAR